MDVQKIRTDFPVLSQKLEGKPIIYLDSACMSLKPRQVIDAIDEYYNEYSGCGGRSVHKISIRVATKIDETREKLKRFINANDNSEIIFTKNSTEGLNLVAYSLVSSGMLDKGDIVLTTDREHNSNLAPWHFLGKLKGIEHRVVSSNEDNTFDLERFTTLMAANRGSIKVVSMVHTSNLDGYCIPAAEIIKIAHEHDALVMLDGAQSAAHKPIDIQKLDVDFFVFSIHKMCGPTGVGVLYGKYDLLNEMEPFIVGGETVGNTTYEGLSFLPPPQKFEAGLQNYAGQIGTGAAVDYLTNIGMENICEHEKDLNRIMTELLINLPGLTLIGPKAPNLRAGIFSFNIEHLNSHDLAMILDEEENIMIRSGMQCVHSWFNAHKIDGAARASVYLYNTEEEVKLFAEKLEEIVDSFSK